MEENRDVVEKKYIGKIEKVFHSGNKWSSILIQTNDKQKYVASGSISNPMVNAEIELFGQYTKNGSYGMQIKVSKSIISSKYSPTSLAYLSFLSSGVIKGVGPKIAERIVDKFGDETLNIIENDPDKLECIKGISENKVEKIIDSYEKNANKPLLDLYILLKGAITPNQANALLKFYGDKAAKKIKENPYILIKDVEGFGFIKTDNIALSMGVQEDSNFRIEASIIHCLRIAANEKGHCYLTVDELRVQLLKLLVPFPYPKMKKKTVEYIINNININNKEYMINNNLYTKEEIENIESWMYKHEIYLKKFVEVLKEFAYFIGKTTNPLEDMNNVINSKKSIVIEDKERFYELNYYLAENRISYYIYTNSLKKPIKNISKEVINNSIKTIENKKGYALNNEQKLAINKSLQSRISVITGGPGRGKTTIIQAIAYAWNDNDKLILLAPTGRASQRMSESTGYNASTIHRKLMQSGGFPEKSLIIVDESSMIDLFLMDRLLKNVNNCNIIFVGDVDQLPSVGTGMILKNLIDTPSVTTSFLKEGHRNEGSISANSMKINKGLLINSYNYDDNFKFTIREREDAIDEIIKQYFEYLKDYKMSDIAVIIPVKAERFMVNTQKINKLIQDKLNHNKKSILNKKLRLGDRVMNIKNDYSIDVIFPTYKTKGVFNGECGEIIDVNEVDEEITVLFDEGKKVVYNSFNANDKLTLAYAITTHKSQGSEYKVVIYVQNNEHYVMLNRSIFYTGMSRAKEIVSLIGDINAFNTSVKRNESITRNTFLSERISFYSVNNVAIN